MRPEHHAYSYIKIYPLLCLPACFLAHTASDVNDKYQQLIRYREHATKGSYE